MKNAIQIENLGNIVNFAAEKHKGTTNIPFRKRNTGKDMNSDIEINDLQHWVESQMIRGRLN